MAPSPRPEAEVGRPRALASRIAPRTLVRARRVAALVLLLAPGPAVLFTDLASRRDQIGHWDPSIARTYVLTAVLSAVLWCALLAVAAQRRGWTRWLGRGLLVLCSGLTVGAQIYFFHRYGAFLNHRAVLVGTSILPSVGQQLWSDRIAFLRSVGPPVLLALLLPLVIARVRAVRRARGRFALDLGCAALAVAVFYAAPSEGGEQGATPDVLYFSSMGKLLSAKWQGDQALAKNLPGPRAPAPIAKLAARPPLRRNVVLVVNESVRSDEACVAYSPDCKTQPFTNALFPDRVPLRGARSTGSTTAISLAVLWGGMAPTASREDFHTMPLVWEYAHAAGMDTAYWSAQHMFFANAGLWLEAVPFGHFVGATQLDPDATYETGADDAKLADWAIRDLPTVREPFVGVFHLSNTHFPYIIDPADAPFQPQSQAMGAGDQAEVKNRYRDALHRQDKHVARFLRALRETEAGKRTIVVYMSDHGEQIRERGAIGHTFHVHEEEIRIAAWIDAPPGTLTDAERAALGRSSDASVSTVDALPTVLDLLGLWDAPELAAHRAKMAGTSLLRGPPPGDRALVLTNCAEIFACASKNWGAIRGTRKIMATQSDHAWRCYDLATDPHEETDLGEDACADLRDVAEGGGRGRPF